MIFYLIIIPVAYFTFISFFRKILRAQRKERTRRAMLIIRKVMKLTIE